MAKPIRSDIPYKDRLLLEKYRTIKEHRDDAAGGLWGRAGAVPGETAPYQAAGI